MINVKYINNDHFSDLNDNVIDNVKVIKFT